MSNKLSRSISSKQNPAQNTLTYIPLSMYSVFIFIHLCVLYVFVVIYFVLNSTFNLFSIVCWPSLICVIICLKMRCNGQITYISLINCATLLSSDLPFSFLSLLNIHIRMEEQTVSPIEALVVYMIRQFPY